MKNIKISLAILSFIIAGCNKAEKSPLAETKAEQSILDKMNGKWNSKDYLAFNNIAGVDDGPQVIIKTTKDSVIVDRSTAKGRIIYKQKIDSIARDTVFTKEEKHPPVFYTFQNESLHMIEPVTTTFSMTTVLIRE